MRSFYVTSILLLAAISVWAGNYTTSFPLTENPISEGGNWSNGRTDGLDWFNVQTVPGRAYGEPSPSSPKYADPTAILKGTWGPNQTVTATVFSVNPTSSYYQEVEIRLRQTVAAHSITGYEVIWRCLTDGNGYAQVVKWNGQFASFMYIDSRTGAGYGVANGDIVKASIIGNVISVYKNGNLQFTAADNTFSTGNPGMGFNYGVGSTNANFGFTSFTATDGVTATRTDLPAARAGRQAMRRFMVVSRHSNAGVCIRTTSTEGNGKNTRIFDLFGHDINRALVKDTK